MKPLLSISLLLAFFLSVPSLQAQEEFRSSEENQKILENAFRPGQEIEIKGMRFFLEKIADGKLTLSAPQAPTATLGAFIMPVDATASHAQDARGINKVIDGSGWGETFPGSGVFVHTNNVYEGGTNMWNGAGNRPEAWMLFDLGSERNVAGLYVWNYNEGGGWQARGVREFELLVSSDGNTFRPLGNFTLKEASGKPDDKGETIPFDAPVKGRYFKLVIVSNYNPNEVSGLSEIRFADADKAAPLPGKTAWQAKYPSPVHPKLKSGQKLEGEENIVFPDDMGIVDVTKSPYFAKGDGVTDDTAAIQQALDDHPDMGAIIYLPNGMYRVTETIRWPKRDGDENTIKRTTMQGQSRKGTVLRLDDAAATFADPRKPRAVLWTGKAPAQRFGNEIRNLTVDTGKENPGACGIQFMANNQGGVFDTTIISGDGQGVVGLDMAYTDEEGPLLIKNVHVQGFNVGIATATALASETMEHVSLSHQNVVGFRNDGQAVSVRCLTSRNEVPAVINSGGVLSLIDCNLVGTGEASTRAAVFNGACILIKNLKTSGYAQTLENKDGADTKRISEPEITEFRFPAPLTLFDRGTSTPGLLIEETPEIPWEQDLSKWASPLQYGAVLDDGQDDSDAIQRAIDSGATTVYLPRGTYHIGKTIILRKNVRRLIGGKLYLVVLDSFRNQGKPIIRFEDGAAENVVVENIFTDFSNGSFYFIEHASKRTLVLKSLMINFQGPDGYRNVGTGKVFMEDVVVPTCRFKEQTVWGRQFNCETVPGDHVVNDGGTLWILGYKTEGGGTQIETKGKGTTEVLGGLIGDTSEGKRAPMFINDNSRVSVTVAEVCFNNDPFDKIVREVRGKETKMWRLEEDLSGMRYIVYEGSDAQK